MRCLFMGELDQCVHAFNLNFGHLPCFLPLKTQMGLLSIIKKVKQREREMRLLILYESITFPFLFLTLYQRVG